MTEKYNEPLLPDDYPICRGFYYLLDGEVIKSEYGGITCSELKKIMKGIELRRCDIVRRNII